MSAVENHILIWVVLGLVILVGMGVGMFFLGRYLGRAALRTPGALVEHTGAGVGKGVASLSKGVGESLEHLASGTGNSIQQLAEGLGNGLEYMVEKGGDSAEKLVESCRKVIGQLCGIHEDVQENLPRKTYIAFRTHGEKTHNINEWATASKEITVEHDYKYKSLLGEVTIRQRETYTVKAGIPLNSVCVEMPDEEPGLVAQGHENRVAKEIIYHVPRAQILSCTPVAGSFDTMTSKKIWQSISDDRQQEARKQLLEAADAYARETDILIIAENNVRHSLMKKHQELAEMKDYGCLVKYDALPETLVLIEEKGNG